MARPAAATEFPLHLCEVIEEELEALRPEAGREPGEEGACTAWDFTPDQIREEADRKSVV